ncbi:transcriptional regulator with XRE-family HTH domain [Bartonella fuyuanensis]|uniref:Transcriptional regulator with XRE-family HTH domain n=1 Tax=Bartonella fuyuanensis TaxID=1460968 RepID=A0A840E247_9HYPH|nr:helix-turn-helix transcriptional regulator [Bartonella fuyuanensis]MBB4077047.1 transcriptional regulator with XRE-family HTH domain [Bartonella fuyuanensis]
MTRQRNEPKTPLARRLIEVRKLVGLSRDIFSLKIGISIQGLGNYERGDRTPDATVLTSYGEKFGVNLNWLLTGEDEMFINMMKTQSFNISPPTIPAGLMKKLGRIAYTTYRDAKIKLPPEDIAELAAELYGKLQELVQDINDTEEVELILPLLKLHLKRQIEAKNAHPETT